MIPRNFNLSELLNKNRSVLLLGPRGVGKTKLIRDTLSHYPNTIELDLLKSENHRRFAAHPESLREDVEFEIRRKGNVVVFIDEVQRAPQLLNEVHALIETYQSQVQWVLTGSSARKLRREGTNLLAGRLRQAKLHPITFHELEQPLARALQFGQLPAAINDPDVTFLESYVDLYLREEVYQESLVRKQEVFARFLDVAAQHSGELVSYAKIARMSNTTEVTVREYFQILADTLLVHRLDAFSYSAAKQISQRPRFYFFDIGVLNAARGEASVKFNPNSNRGGKQFEHLVILELIRMNDYCNRRFNFGHFRESEKLEVDIVLFRGMSDPLIAIEIKVNETPEAIDIRGLLRFKELHPHATLLCLTAGARSFDLLGVSVMPWQRGVNDIMLTTTVDSSGIPLPK